MHTYTLPLFLITTSVRATAKCIETNRHLPLQIKSGIPLLPWNDLRSGFSCAICLSERQNDLHRNDGVNFDLIPIVLLLSSAALYLLPLWTLEPFYQREKFFVDKRESGTD